MQVAVKTGFKIQEHDCCHVQTSESVAPSSKDTHYNHTQIGEITCFVYL